MQQALPFEDLPQPSQALWNQLEHAVRREAVEKLTQLMAQTAQSMHGTPEATDE